VPDRDMPPERGERRFVERLADETHVLVNENLTPVTDCDPRRLLPPVLQGIEPEIGEFGNLFPRRPNPEDATGVLRSQVLRVQIMSEPTIATSHTSSLRDVRHSPGRTEFQRADRAGPARRWLVHSPAS
jgi:hypothetical protein